MPSIQQKDIDEALKGLTNRNVFTAHPRADKVIRMLWSEVKHHREKKMVELSEQDKAAIKQFENDLADMSVQALKRDLNTVTAQIDEDTSWQEALTARLRQLGEL